MQRPNVRLAQLLVIQPVYIEGIGVGSRMWLADGRILEDAHSPQASMKHVLAQEGIDAAAHRRKIRESTGARQVAPVVVRERAYIACKMIKPRVRGDETYGFVRVDAVGEVARGPFGATIILIGGERIDTFHTAPTVHRHLAEASLASRRMLREERAADAGWQAYLAEFEPSRVGERPLPHSGWRNAPGL